MIHFILQIGSAWICMMILIHVGAFILQPIVRKRFDD